jgi:hypothetical protein
MFSALPLKADSRRTSPEVRFVPCVDGSGLARKNFTSQPWHSRAGGGAVHSINSGNSSAGYPHAVGVNRSDMFHMATSSSGREAVASRRAASRFERAR